MQMKVFAISFLAAVATAAADCCGDNCMMSDGGRLPVQSTTECCGRASAAFDLLHEGGAHNSVCQAFRNAAEVCGCCGSFESALQSALQQGCGGDPSMDLKNATAKLIAASEAVSAAAVPDTNLTTSYSQLPGDFLKLDNHWEIELPIAGSDKECKQYHGSGSHHCEIRSSNMLKFTDKWYQMDSDNKAVVFKVPVYGAGSKDGGIRTEIKASYTSGYPCWKPTDKKEHTLTVDMVITKLAHEKQLTVYQLHGEGDGGDDIIKVQVHGGDFRVEIKDGVKEVLIKDYEVGHRFKGEIKVSNGVADFYIDGEKKQTIKFTSAMKKLIGKCGTWHAGAYSPGDSSPDKDDYAEMKIYSIVATGAESELLV